MERIMTLHPKGKKGVNIEKTKYDQMRACILDVISAQQPILLKSLNEEVEARLDGSFDGSVIWYLICVKQDLEARGEIELVPKKSPQQLRLGTPPE